MRIPIIITSAVVAAATLLYGSARADGPSLHGFLQGAYSTNTDSKNPDGGGSKLTEERVQIRLDGSAERLRYYLKTDLFYDHVDGHGSGEVREGYVDFTASGWELRVGRQVVTWGLGDLVFINDVFPKDHGAFFSKRPMEYLKKGVDAVKLGLYPSEVSIDVVAIPFFEPNTLPDSDRFHLYDPMPSVTARGRSERASTPRNMEVALRAYRDVAGFEGALYFYNGYYRNPSMKPDNAGAPTRITLNYPRLMVYGASLQKGALDGVVSLEAGYYDSVEDRDGVDPFIPNPEAKLLVGYQRQLAEDLTLGLQYTADHMQKYASYERALPAGFPREPHTRQLVSLRLTYLMLHQQLKLSWFSMHGISDKDRYLNPEASYHFTDQLWGAVGLNVFGAKSGTTQFGSLDRDDNAYLHARYEF